MSAYFIPCKKKIGDCPEVSAVIFCAQKQTGLILVFKVEMCLLFFILMVITEEKMHNHN